MKELKTDDSSESVDCGRQSSMFQGEYMFQGSKFHRPNNRIKRPPTVWHSEEKISVDLISLRKIADAR